MTSSTPDVQEKYDLFSSTLLEAVNKAFPLKPTKCSPRTNHGDSYECTKSVMSVFQKEVYPTHYQPPLELI